MKEARKCWIDDVLPLWGELRMAAKDDATGINPADLATVRDCAERLKDSLEEFEIFLDNIE